MEMKGERNPGTENFIPGHVFQEIHNDIFVCIVEFEKVFDRLWHGQMMETLIELGVDMAYLRVLTDMYWEQKAVVRFGEDNCGNGCDARLSAITQQFLVTDGQVELEGMLRVGGRFIDNIRYADDTVLIADSEEKLQLAVDCLYTECRRYGLDVNEQQKEVTGLSKRREQLVVT